MATNSTDYVSLRRLVDYHNNVVLKAIETSGKVNDVGYGTGSNFTTYLKEYTDENGNKKMRAEIPAATAAAAGLMTTTQVIALDFAVKSVNTLPTNNIKAPEITQGTLHLPMASTAGVTAGLLSNDDYEILKSVGEILGDPETSEGAINTLYEVIDFLDQHASGTDLVEILNGKAVKTGDNAFNGTNTFEGDTVTFKAVTNKPSATFVGPIAFGQALTSINVGYKSNIFAFYSNTKTLNLPFGEASSGDYLTIVKKYGDNDTEAETEVPVLLECQPITETTWATIVA